MDSLPPELLHQVVRLLPIDPLLPNLGWTCIGCALSLLSSASSALAHVKYYVSRVDRLESLWTASVASTSTFYGLPLTYRCAIISLMLTEDPLLILSLIDPVCSNKSRVTILRFLNLNASVYQAPLDSPIFLQWAAQSGDMESLEYLLDSKIGSNPAAHNNAALNLAVQHGHLEIAKHLLKYKDVDPSFSSNFAIRVAARRGDTTVMSLLLEDPRTNPSASKNLALVLAAGQGHIDAVRMLLSSPKLDLSDGAGGRAIVMAAHGGFEEIVEALVEDGRADLATSGHYIVRWAANRGCWKLLESLLRHETVDPSSEGNMPLIQAAMMGHTEAVRILLAQARVMVDIEGVQHARSLAFARGHLSVVALIDSYVNQEGEPGNKGKNS